MAGEAYRLTVVITINGSTVLAKLPKEWSSMILKNKLQACKHAIEFFERRQRERDQAVGALNDIRRRIEETIEEVGSP